MKNIKRFYKEEAEHIASNRHEAVCDVSMPIFMYGFKVDPKMEDISKTEIAMDILLEINIGNEQSKSGFSPDEAVCAVEEIARLDGIRIKGLMAIPPICENPEQNRPYFAKMKKLFIDIGSKKIDNSSMDILSMGMSDDYQVAIEEGATMVRLGTALFGRRNYNI